MLPEGWTSAELGDLVDRPIAYGVLKPSAVADGVPMIRINNVATGGRLNTHDLMHITPEQSNEYRRTRVRPGDLALSVVGTIGRLFEVPTSLGGANLSRALCVIGIADPVLRSFVQHILRGDTAQEWMQSLVIGAAQKVLNLGVLRTFPVPLPPLHEQRRITAILDAWGAAIATAERLAEANVAMRGNLERRLIGEGDSRRLSDLATVVFSGVDKKVVEGEASVRLCNYMDVLNNRRLTNTLAFSAGSATELERQRFALRRGDVVFTKDSETAGDIAEPSCVIEDLDNVVCGYHLAIARPRDGVSGAFLTHAIRSPKLRQQFVKRANGAIRFGLTLEAMDQIELPMPSYDRQLLIADALDAADAEAISTRALIAALRQQKRGLMQLLLTGKLRVPESIDELTPSASPPMLDQAAA